MEDDEPKLPGLVQSLMTPGKTQRTSGTDKVHVSATAQRDAANVHITNGAGGAPGGGP